MFWATNAYAMGGGGGEAGGFAAFVPLILMFVVFYFLLIRPQQKKAKEHQAMLNSVKRGDEIITAGGLHGRVLEVTEQYLTVDLGESKIKLSRNAVSAIVGHAKVVDKAEKQSKKSDKGGSEDEKAEAAEIKESKSKSKSKGKSRDTDKDS